LIACACFCIAIWCFGDIFIESPYSSRSTAVLFTDIACLGWCGFPVFYLWFCLAFAGREKVLKTKLIYLIFIVAPLLLIYKQWTDSLVIVDPGRQWYGWGYTWLNSIWFYAYVFYYVSFTLMAVYLLFDIWQRAENAIKRKQAKIIVCTTLVAFAVGSATNVVFPMLNLKVVPATAQIAILIWVGGIVYAVIKYRLMIFNPEAAAQDIINTMSDSLILLDLQQKILDVNPSAVDIFRSRRKELIGKGIHDIFKKNALFEKSAFKLSVLKHAIRNLEISFKRNDGVSIFLNVSASIVVDSYGQRLGIIVIIRDITENKRVQEKLEHLATHDFLTNLPNRLLLEDFLAMAIGRARRHNWMVGILLLDLDRFKEVNDEWGHAVGDSVLKEISRRLKKITRDYDVVARIGGDEFIIVISDLNRAEDIKSVADRIRNIFDSPVVIGDNELHVVASIGISLFPDDGESMDKLIGNADMAMYHAKKQGGNAYSFFSLAMSAEVKEEPI